MNILEARRRTLGADVYKKTASGNPVNVGSLARMRPGLSIMGKSTQNKTTGAQLFDASQIKDGFVSGATIGESFSVSNNQEYPNAQYVEIDVSDIEIISWDLTGCLNDRGALRIRYFDADGTSIKTGSIVAESGVVNVYDVDKIYVMAIKAFNEIAESKAMVNSGNKILPWEPYTGGKPSPSTDYPQEITSVGDDGEIEVTMVNDGYVEKGMALNIIKKIALKKGSYIYCKNQIKSSIMNAFIVNDPDLIATSGGAISNGNSLHSYCYNNLGMVTIEKSGTTITKNARIYQYWESGVVYRIDSDGLYLYYSINNSSYNDTEDGFVWFLDHEGSKERPYTSQSLTVQTPNGLPGIPVTSGGNYTDSTGQQWVCDEIDFKRGKYVQRVKKVVIDSSFLIVQQPNASNQFAINVRKELGEIASVRNPVVANIARTAIPIDAPHPAQIFQYEFFIYWYGADIFPDVQSFKDWLDTDGNTFYVIGQLATPIETDLTPEQMAAYESLHTNRPTTVVSATDGAGLELTYKTKKSLEVTA